jgi:hypothetical protein
MLDRQTAVEMKLSGRFKVAPQIAGAIKAVSGVVDVQTLQAAADLVAPTCNASANPSHF